MPHISELEQKVLTELKEIKPCMSYSARQSIAAQLELPPLVTSSEVREEHGDYINAANMSAFLSDLEHILDKRSLNGDSAATVAIVAGAGAKFGKHFRHVFSQANDITRWLKDEELELHDLVSNIPDHKNRQAVRLLAALYSHLIDISKVAVELPPMPALAPVAQLHPVKTPESN